MSTEYPEVGSRWRWKGGDAPLVVVRAPEATAEWVGVQDDDGFWWYPLVSTFRDEYERAEDE